MTLRAVTSAGFDFSLFNRGSKGIAGSLLPEGRNANGGRADPAQFAATLAQRVAEFKLQMLGSLTGSTFTPDAAGTADQRSGVGALLASMQGAGKAPTKNFENAYETAFGSVDDKAESRALALTGRNTALFDPELAYRMMSDINTAEVNFKARYAELREMKPYLAEMHQFGQNIEQIDAATSDDSIRTQLRDLAERYNAWVARFDADMLPGGVLHGTQAAEISRWELEQSIESGFHGLGSGGVRGLSGLGFAIDPASGLASLDTARLDAALADNRPGAIDALREFGANFAKAADLLNSEGNFIANRVANLGRVIAYINEHKPDLQTEFGLGDAARPDAQTARALAAYTRTWANTLSEAA